MFSSTLRSERRSVGGTLGLRLEDWPMQFQYGESQTRQKGLSSRDLDLFEREDESFRYWLEHDFSESSDLSFEFESVDVRQKRRDTLFDRKEDRYNVQHNSRFGADRQHWFDSYLNFLDQSGDLELEQLRWQERLRLRHSDIFETNYGFAFDESERPTLENDRTQYDAGFLYRLFQSLVTKGSIYASEADLGNGVEVTRDGYKLGFDYRKKNRWGTFFANYTTGVLNLEQTGGSTLVNVVDERHPFLITGSLRMSLYYEYRSRDERLRSTDTDIIPDEFEINTFGTDYINKNFRLLAEYGRNKSTRIPWRSKRLEASYARGLNPDRNISVYASNSWIDYMGTVPYDITLLVLGAAASSKLTDNYSIFGNIDYRDEDDTRQGKTEGFQSAVELRYSLRQLSFRTGVEFNSLDRLGYETDNTFLYFRLKRTF